MHEDYEPVINVDADSDIEATFGNNQTVSSNGLMPPGDVQERLAYIAGQRPDPLTLHHMLTTLKEESGYPFGRLNDAFQQIQKSSGESDLPSAEFAEETRLEAETLAKEQNLFKTFALELPETGYVTDELHATCMLIACSLTLTKTVHYVCFYGDTSSGKSAAAERCRDFIDHDQKRRGLAMTVLNSSANWLKYAGGSDGEGLFRKLLFLDELNPTNSGQDDYRQSIMRQVDSPNSDSVTFGSVDRNDGKAYSERRMVLKKPIFFLFTSLTPPHRWDEQNRNRNYWLEFDHDDTSVGAVLESIAKRESGEADSTNADSIYERWNYFFQRIACRLTNENPDEYFDVIIPFCKEIIPKHDRKEGSDLRRFKMLIACIKGSTLLHAKNRQTKILNGKRFLVAEQKDYRMIAEAFEIFVPRVTTPSGVAYLNTLRKIGLALFESDTGQDRYWLKEKCALKKREREDHPKTLVEVGLLKIVPPQDYSRRTHYQLSDAVRNEIKQRRSASPKSDVSAIVQEVLKRHIELVLAQHRIEIVEFPEESQTPPETSGEL